jgi:hypothetical protein
MGLRELVKSKPWVGWAVAGVLLLVAILVYVRPGGNRAAYTLEQLDQDVVIRDRDTGEEWTIKRGRLEAILWERAGTLDPSVGLPNPKTGTLTGFPKSDWEETVERIDRDRREAARAYGRTSTPAPNPPK